MDNNINILPTRNVRFENGILRFNCFVNGAYWPEEDAFTGEWIEAHLKTKEGEPVRVEIEGEKMIIRKLTNYLVEESTGKLVGGEIVEICRFNIYK